MDKKRDIGKAVKGRLSHVEKSPKNLSWAKMEAKLDENQKDEKFFLFKKRNVAALILFFMASGFIINQYYLSSNVKKNNQDIDNKETITNKNTYNDTKKIVTKNSYFNSEQINAAIDLPEEDLLNKKTKKLVNHNPEKSFVKNSPHKIKDTSHFNGTSKSSTSTINDLEQSTKKNIVDNNYSFQSKNDNTLEVAKQDITSEKTINKHKDTILFMYPEEQKLAEKSKKIVPTISVHITPNYAYTNYLNKSFITDNIEPNSKNGKISLSYGVSLGFKLNNKTTLRFGYDRTSIKYKEKDILSDEIINTAPSLGINISDNIRNELESSEFTSLTQQINYHKASLGFLYKIYDKKIVTSVSGDLGFLFQEKNEINLKVNDQTANTGENKNILDGNISADLGINLSFPLLKRVHFFMEPQVEYYIFYDDKTNGNPILFNLRTGLLFDLNK